MGSSRLSQSDCPVDSEAHQLAGFTASAGFAFHRAYRYVYAAALVQTAAVTLIITGAIPAALDWLQAALLVSIRDALWLYFWAIFIYALASMISPGVRSPLQSLLESLCEPILGRIRRAVPAIGGLDLSPMWAGIIIQVLLILLRG
jgi:YggT family protein